MTLSKKTDVDKKIPKTIFKSKKDFKPKKKFKDNFNVIKIKNFKKFSEDAEESVKEINFAYNNRQKDENGFKHFRNVFKDKFKKLSENVILGNKYNKFVNKKKGGSKNIYKIVIYILLTITVLSVKNMELIKTFVDSTREYLNSVSPDNREFTTGFVKIITIFYDKLKELTILKRLLVGVIFTNTIVNDIPSSIENVDFMTQLPYFEMLKRTLENLVKVETSLFKNN